ncbi:hypothetical protein N752_10330 [Desulforamulus aquiferis]|nr:hypothetical protein N752_10330 [Desulforamulus aquiferis]
MEPRILLLDEPTAGLDPRGQRQLMNLFSDICKEHKVTVVLVTHDMEEVARRPIVYRYYIMVSYICRAHRQKSFIV